MVSCDNCGSTINVVEYYLPHSFNNETIHHCHSCGRPEQCFEWIYDVPVEREIRCFECLCQITTTKMGCGIALKTPDPIIECSNRYRVGFCPDCTIKRNGRQLINEYWGRLTDLYERTNQFFE